MSKVVMIGPAHPFRGGLATYNERLAREFQNQGHQVTMHTFTLQYPSFLFPGKSQYSTSPPPEGLEIHRSVNSINPLNWWRLGVKLRKQRPDLIITKFWLPFMGPCLGAINRLAGKNNHTVSISVIDNIIPHEKRFGDFPLANYYVRSMDGFVVQSQSVMDDLKKFDEFKPRAFNPHPVFDNFGETIPREEALQKLKLDPQYRYILFFGFIRHYKGLDLLLEAMADDELKQLPVRLIIAGEYYEKASFYRELMVQHHLAGRVVEFADFIPDEYVHRYFSAADLVVQPYRSATQSGVAQVAFNFSKPMVVTNVGGLAEIVPDGKAGFVVEPVPSQIANAITRFFHENLEAEFTAGAKEEKKKYEWKTMVDTILSVEDQVRTKKIADKFRKLKV